MYAIVQSRAGRFFSLLLLADLRCALLLTLIFAHRSPQSIRSRQVARETLTLVYVVAMILSGHCDLGSRAGA